VVCEVMGNLNVLCIWKLINVRIWWKHTHTLHTWMSMNSQYICLSLFVAHNSGSPLELGIKKRFHWLLWEQAASAYEVGLCELLERCIFSWILLVVICPLLYTLYIYRLVTTLVHWCGITTHWVCSLLMKWIII